jgi:glycosyltransferase involved in cell wall biosynthesis
VRTDRIAVIDTDGLNPYGACLVEALSSPRRRIDYLRRSAPVQHRLGATFGPMRGGSSSRVLRALQLGAGLATVVWRARRAQTVLLLWETAGDGLIAGALRLLRRPRLVATLHDPRRAGANHRFARWMLTRYADRIVMHSRPLADEFVHSTGIPRERVVVLPHPSFAGLTTAMSREAARCELGLPEEANLIVFFGQIRRYKGVDVLAAGMDRVFAVRQDVHLLVVGTAVDTELTHQLEELAERHRAGVTLMVSPRPVDGGVIDEAVSAADLVVLPFTDASQSGSVIHALSLDRPVLTTRVGELAALADLGVVAAVAPGDAELLAEAILDLIADPGRRVDLVRAGERYVSSDLDPTRIGERLLDELGAA